MKTSNSAQLFILTLIMINNQNFKVLLHVILKVESSYNNITLTFLLRSSLFDMFFFLSLLITFCLIFPMNNQRNAVIILNYVQFEHVKFMQQHRIRYYSYRNN